MSAISFHTFMFPFQWKINGYDGRPFSEQVDLENICYAFSSNWERMPKPIVEDEKDGLYNERNYFYEFVHPALYDDGSHQTLVRHYERSEPKHGDVTYHIVCGRHHDEYILDVQSINLNLYATGVGVLSIYLNNNRYTEIKDVLAINQYGRRVFPPFIADVNDRKEIAHSLSFEGLNGVYGEDFSGYSNKTPNNHPAAFIGKMVSEVAENIMMQPVIDDRMFVLCWYMNNEWAAGFDSDYNKFISENKEWYKFVFVDNMGGLSCYNDEMRKELIRKATYERWQGLYSLYGISRYSMVYLTNTGTTTEAPFLFTNFETEYVRMAELVLMQRASVLRFSAEVTQISKLSGTKDFGERVSSLYREYIRFVNRFYFREISAQDQAIEIYQKLYDAMNLKEQVEKLDGEIEELHNYVSMREESRTNRTMSLLTWITTIFLPVTVVAGYFSMNDFGENPKFLFESILMICFAIVVISIVLIINKKRIR